MHENEAKLNRCKKLLATPPKVDRNREPHAAEGRPEQGTAEVPVLPVFPAGVPVPEVPVCDLSLRKGSQYRVPEKTP